MPVEIRVPTLGESIVEATVGKWLKEEGDPVAAGEALVELETDKVNLEVVAETAGMLGSIARHTGENVGIGELLGTIESAGASAPAPAAPPPAPVEARPAAAPPEDGRASARQPSTGSGGTDTDAKVPASPVAQRIATEQGVDLRGITGSGPGGRITKE